MSTKHTTGPWWIWKDWALKAKKVAPEDITDELLACSEHEIFAGIPDEIDETRLVGNGFTEITTVSDDCQANTDDETRLANARLIAAAPDLLEACKALLDMDRDRITEARRLAHAAVRKAEGG